MLFRPVIAASGYRLLISNDQKGKVRKKERMKETMKKKKKRWARRFYFLDVPPVRLNLLAQ